MDASCLWGFPIILLPLRGACPAWLFKKCAKFGTIGTLSSQKRIEYKPNIKVLMEENIYEYAKSHGQIYEYWCAIDRYFVDSGREYNHAHSPGTTYFYFVEAEKRQGEVEMFRRFDDQLVYCMGKDYYNGKFHSYDLIINVLICVFFLLRDCHEGVYKKQFIGSEKLRQCLRSSYDYWLIHLTPNDDSWSEYGHLVSEANSLKERFGFEF
ncbi:MAG: hypothetical protein IK131_06715 [Paludibacteraceae bacterium]|nr:hypothetical protein [Paludibacteraceae bacterium]